MNELKNNTKLLLLPLVVIINKTYVYIKPK